MFPGLFQLWLINGFSTDEFNRYDLDHMKAESLMKELGFFRNESGKWCDIKGKPLKFNISCKSGIADFFNDRR